MSLEEDKIRKQDFMLVLSQTSVTAPGRTLAWNFVKRNWPEINRRYALFLPVTHL